MSCSYKKQSLMDNFLSIIGGHVYIGTQKQSVMDYNVLNIAGVCNTIALVIPSVLGY